MPPDPKPPKRIRDPDLLRRFRLLHLNEICEGCGLVPGIDPHHAKFKSQLGDDADYNLRWLCQICHDAAHGIRSFC